MNEIWLFLQRAFSPGDPLFWLALLDLFLVYYLIYRVLLLFKGTKAAQMIQGILLLIALYFASKALELRTFTWILDQIFSYSVLILVILFQNNIRRILPKLGLNPFNRQQTFSDLGDQRIPEIVRAVELLSSKKIGALIVLEREAELTSYIQQGTDLDALASKELLFNLFLPYAPLHDGAAILHNGRITRAGCFLPLTTQPEIPKHLGTRHRAGIGITENTDAIAVIVSETDGRISLCQDGKLKRVQTPSDLNNELANRLRLPSAKSPKPPKKSKDEKPEKSEREDKPDKPDKADKADKADKPDKADKADKPDKTDKADKPDKTDKADKERAKEKDGNRDREPKERDTSPKPEKTIRSKELKDDKPKDDRPKDDKPKEAKDDKPKDSKDDRPKEAKDDKPKEDRPKEAKDDKPKDDKAKDVETPPSDLRP